MSLMPGKCWANREMDDDIPCSQPLQTLGHCPGGIECSHRFEVHQCSRLEATEVGLCIECYERIIGIGYEGNKVSMTNG